MKQRASSKPTSFDIAQRAGVSQPTVSRALRGSKSVNEATRRKIERIARELNYTVDKHASSLRSQRSHTLALLFFEDPTPDDSMINPFLLAMLGSIARRCADCDYDLLVNFQHISTDWCRDYQYSHRADGLILLGYGNYQNYQARLRELVAQETCFVRWGAVRHGNIEPTVGSDNLKAGEIAVHHLLAQGRRHIAFLGTASAEYPEFQDRYRGMQNALAASGLSIDPHLQQQRYADALSSEAEGYQATMQLLRKDIAFDSIFAASDLIAIGAMRALVEAGKDIPRDVALIGFDNIPTASLTSPPLTTIMQDVRRGGAALVDMVCARIAGQSPPPILLPTKLVVRQSCGAARAETQTIQETI